MKQKNQVSSQVKKPALAIKLLLLIIGLFIGFLCIEGGLRIAEALKVDWLFFANEGISEYLVPDEKVGFRIEPGAPGHDDAGWRNKKALEKADIVAIGDSQTWGVNAKLSDSWPGQLAALSGQSVYNMGLGYYGPAKYSVLLPEALQLSPETVVIGFYFGNDIFDTYNTVYTNDYYSDMRMDNPPPDTVTSQSRSVSSEWGEYTASVETSFFARAGAQINKYFRTTRLLWRTWRILNRSAYKQYEAWALANPDEAVIYRQGDVTGILGPAYRLPVMNMDEPCIVEGIRLTKEAFLKMREDAAAADTRLLVLLIPTQESVYSEAVEKAGLMIPVYEEMVAMEARARNEITAFLTENGISYADALPALSAAAGRGDILYPPQIDGHPVSGGYRVIASVVYEKLQELDRGK